MKNIKLNIITLTIASLGLFTSCDSYLDVVPDKSQDISLLFERKEIAYNALASCYHYLPHEDDVYKTSIFTADELITPITKLTAGGEIMRGKQNSSDPYEGCWTDTHFQSTKINVWEGVRYCNTLIENIDAVVDMTDEEKAMWKAEAKVLKAWYHFMLFRQYGPIPIVDANLPITATIEQIRVKRASVDEVVNYIVNTINEAAPFLPERVIGTNDLGRIDRVIALSIKSRVLLYGASPLFNGNAAFYENFKNSEGAQLINTTYDAEKWKQAADAAKEAIDLALNNQVEIYTFKGNVPLWDEKAYQKDEMKAYYDYRYAIVDKWNSEVIWGLSDPVRDGNWSNIQSAIGMLIQDGTTLNEAAWGWASPTLAAVESYYTKNGLPMNEDPEWLNFYCADDYENRYKIYPTNYKRDPFSFENDSLHCVFTNPNTGTREVALMMHLGREPRFYSSIGYDRGYNRTRGSIFPILARYNEQSGRRTSNDYSASGYYCTKLVHPDSDGAGYNLLISYAWPYFRLSELYLNYAEALNEYYGPSQDVYDALNVVRRRAGIPDVEVAWAKAVTADKHTTKEGLREIIHAERRIELAFEGHRNFDVRRWKDGEKSFAAAAMGWDTSKTGTAFYNNSTPVVVGQRSFISPRDYLWPIKDYEIIINPNLVQNPGW